MRRSRFVVRVGGIVLFVSVLMLVGCSIFQPKLEVDIAASETEGVTPMLVEFSPVVTGEISACYWDFGDGETSTETNPVHVYRAAGTYDVFLSVTLVSGQHASVEKKGLVDVALVSQKVALTDLYWLNANNGSIHRGDRSGYQEETIVSYIYRSGDLAVGAGYIFWTSDQSIYRSNYDGTGKRVIATGQEGLASVTVNGSQNMIFWACWPTMPFTNNQWSGSLKSASLEGGMRWPIEEYDNSGEPYTWFVRSDSGSPILYRYFDDDNYVHPLRATPKAVDNGQLQSLLFPTPTTHATQAVKTSMNGVVTMALDAGEDFARYIYWIAGSAIRRCRVDGSDAMTLLRGLDNPRGVAADIVEGKMYWSDSEGIHRAELDGTSDKLIYPGVRADILVIKE